MASQQDTPYLPVDTAEGHQDDPPPVDTDDPSQAIHPQDAPFDPYGLPAEDVARPRFLGHAAGDGARGSFASSFGIPSTFGDNDNSSSIYALNPLVNRDSGRYSSVPYRDDPHDSDFVARATSPRNRYLEEKRAAYTPPNKSKRKIIIGAIAVGVIVVAIAIVVALYFTVIKKNGNTSSAIGSGDGNNNNTNNNNGNNNNPTNSVLKTGGNGSTITLDDGSKITYYNPFGGSWYWDPSDPFNNNAQAQSWTPPLNKSFQWGTDRVFGSVAELLSKDYVLNLLCSQCQPRWLACNRTCKFPSSLSCSLSLD